MTTIASKAATLLRHRLSRTLFVSTLALRILGASAGPALADGEYVLGPTAMPAWTESTSSRTPLAGAAPTWRTELEGGDNQYLAGPTAFGAAPRSGSRTPLAGPGVTGVNFDLTAQGS